MNARASRTAEYRDVVVVGGGPAGSTIARELTRAGRRVVVMDRAEFPRDKVCAGWITPPVLAALDLTEAEYARGRTLQPFTRFSVGMTDGRQVLTDYRRPVAFGIRRVEFDAFLLQRSGAELVLGGAVRRVERVGSEWVVNDRFRTPMLIGAGGHWCPVARHFVTRDRATTGAVVTAQELEYWLSPDSVEAATIAPECPTLFFCDDLDGYGWAVRKGQYLNVGLGHRGKANVPQRLAQLLTRLECEGAISADGPRHAAGHAYECFATSSRQLTHDGALLIGDAGGMAHAASGEGILPAILSARHAARTILAAGEHFSRSALADYERLLRLEFGERAGRPAPARRPHRRFARWLLARRWFVHHVVLDRWFLHRA